MIAVAKNLTGDNLTLLPPQEAPYRLQEVYELLRDGCRSEVILQWSGSHLEFRVDEDFDSLSFDFHTGDFKPSREHSVPEQISPDEKRVLKHLTKAPRTKQQLGARAKLMGAFTRESYGKQGGGLLKRKLVTATRIGREVQYEITAAGRQALGSTIWCDLLGKECGWTWLAWNQQGYRDSVLFSFEGVIPTVLMTVMASSIEVFSVTGG